MSGAWAVYVRRSQKDESDADVSDETQELVARRRIPEGADVELFKDSGGHNSGYSEDRPEYQRMLDALIGGQLAGISAYDPSRLNRNSEHAGRLYNLCKRLGVPLRWDDTPIDRIFKSDAGLNYGLRSVVDEHTAS